ncbi:MAG: hypothetical protein JXD22_00740 [Sedimentisphaerales bacterium]|nr:hypothetical protein [Sedimentisphaerales bacterium]
MTQTLADIYRQAQGLEITKPGVGKNGKIESIEAIDELASVFAAYNETTDRMLSSYQQLQDEVVRLREEVEHKNEQLERKNRLAALGEMAAGMAHEIRNPLAAIQLYGQLLEKDLREQPDKIKWARKISQGVRNLDAIVTDILAFTQEQICNKTEVNLSGLLAETIDYAAPKGDEQGVVFDLDDVDRELVANVDINMFRRIFLNLIRNAIGAVSGKGRVKVTITRETEDAAYQSRITVSDTGPGIAPEVMSKIFNPFFTTKDTGTGLGLAIVHRLVECHGGTISAGNNQEGGAVFTILLL